VEIRKTNMGYVVQTVRVKFGMQRNRITLLFFYLSHCNVKQIVSSVK